MSDDLFGDVSSEEDLSDREEVDLSSKREERAVVDKKSIFGQLSDDSDEDEGDARRSRPAGKSATVITDEDDDDKEVPRPTKRNDPVAAAKRPLIEPSSAKKKAGSLGLSKKKALSELHGEDRKLAVDKNDAVPFYVKLPKFLKFSSDAFNPDSYNADEEQKRFEAASAVIRWCYDPANPQNILSNAALVQYEDGSYELVVGGSVFNAKVAPAENCYIFERTTCKQTERKHPHGEAHHEDDKETSCSCLVCCGQLNQRFVFEPSSLDSAAHHRIHFNVRNHDQFRQEKKIGTMDLDKLQAMQAINQEQFVKLDKARKSVARQKKRAADSQPRRFAHHRPYMTSQYLEGDEYEDYEDDDDDEDAGKLIAKPKKTPTKRPRARDDDDEDEGESVGHDDEERSEDEDDDGADLDDFIEDDGDDGDADVNEDDLDEKSAEDEEEANEEDEEEEAADDDDEDEESAEEDGSQSSAEKGKKKKAQKKDKHSKRRDKERSRKSPRPESRTKDSKKRRREESQDDEPVVAASTKEATAAASEPEPAPQSMDMDDDDEDVVIHQSKKQRKVLLDSDEDD